MQQAVTASGATTTTSYIGSQEEVTTSNAPGSVTTTTAYYGGIAESVNGTLSYLLSDGLDSVSEAVSTVGSVSATQLYAPYGGVRYQRGTLPTDKGYTGQVSDAASTGLDYYGARYYDPVAGQFTSADTTLAGGLNRYAYVAGNPETRTDPSGHAYTCPTGACGPSAGGDPTAPANPTNPTPVPVPTPTPTPLHQTVKAAGPSHPNFVVTGLEALGLLLKSADFAVIMQKLSKAQRIEELTELLEAFGDHNHWAKRPAAFMSRLAEKAGAEDSLKWWGEVSDKLMLIGAGVDLVQSAWAFYYGDTRLDITGNERWAAAFVYGAMHATVMYGVTVATAAGIDAATVGATAGWDAPAVVASQAVIDMGSAWIGGLAADHATPVIFDQFVPMGSLPDVG